MDKSLIWSGAVGGLAGALSGLVVGVVNLLGKAKSESRDRRIAFLKEQLALLYGPLHFFTKQNQELIGLEGKLEKAYHSAYVEKKYPADSGNPDKVIDIKNEYAALIRENNGRMSKVMEERWSLIDADDCDAFAGFQIHCKRSEKEYDEKRVPKLPFEVLFHDELGHVILYDPQFIELIRQKWEAKQKKLERLLNDVSIFSWRVRDRQ